MDTPLHLLMVEDSADDAELLLYTLRRGGYEVTWQRVDTAEAMRIALQKSDWDIITSDHAMPRFSAPAALALARELRPEIPLIIVSGEIDLNLAVSLMKGGAQDYIQKSELARVVPAIERELNDADHRRRQSQTEDALQRQQNLMARIYDTSPVGIVMVDASGQITFANREAESVFGLTKDSITQLTYNAPIWHITALDGGLFPETELPFVRVMRTGQPVRDVRHAIQWPDGRRVLLSINAAPLTDEAGNLTGMVATLHDITEQINTAESLRDSEARFRTLVNSMNDIVFTLDLQGRHTGVFGSWVEKAGLTPAHFLGRTACEIMGDEAGCVHDEACQRAAQGEKVVYDWEIPSADGSLRYYQTSLSPIYDGEWVIGVVGVGRDVTELKRAEQALRVREAQLNASLENTPNVAVQWYDQDGRVLYWNPASERLYGWSASDALGKTLDQLILDSEEFQLFLNNLRAVSSQNVPQGPGEVSFHRSDGTQGIVLATQFSIPSVGDQPLFVCMDVDITPLKRSQRNLEVLFNTIDDLLFVLDMQGNITHVNQAVCRKLGFSEEALIGQSVLMVHPEKRRAEAAQIVADMLAGSATTCPVPVVTQDGRQLAVETRVMVGEWDGKPALFGITRDISALKLSEEKFSRAFHSGPMVMAISTIAEGRYLDVNHAFLKTSGYTRQEVIGQSSQTLNLFLNPADRAAAQRELYEKGFVENLETQVRRKNGEILTGIFSASPIYIGTEACWLTTMLDITDRKRVEQEVLRWHERLETFFHLMPEIASITRLSDGCFVEVSQAFLNVLGYTRDEIIGHSTAALPLWADPRQRDVFLKTLREQRQVSQFPARVCKKSGDIFPALFSAVAMDVDGEAYLIITVTDMSAQEHSENALRESEEKYRLLVENQQELVVKVDIEGRFLYVSPSYCQAFGKTQEELLGKTYLPLVHEDDRIATEQAVASLYQPPYTCYVEQRALTSSGWRWLAWQDTAVVDENGLVQSIIGVGRDITERKQAEIERDRIFNYSMDMLCMVDANGCFRQINPAWEKTLGWNIAELLGRRYLDFVHPDDQPATYSVAAAQMQGQDVVKFTNRYRCKDGSFKWLSWNSLAVAEGQEIFAVARDVTDQKMTSDALLQSEARYRGLFATMRTGFALHEIICDEGGEPVNYRFLEVNPAFEQLTGLKAGNVLGKTVLDVMPGTENYWIETYGKVVQTGEPAYFENYASELGRHYEGIAYRPKPGQFAVMFSDVTQRKEMEIALRQSEERYRLLVEHSPDAIVVHCEGVLQYVNPMAVNLMRAQHAGELLGQRVINFVHPDQRALVLERIRNMMRTGEMAPLAEEKFLRLDGSTVDVEVTSIPTQYNGKPAAQVIFREITRRKQAEAALQQSEQRSRRTFDEAPIGALLVTPKMNFVRVNRALCQILGYTEAELLQLNMAAITHPDDRASSQQKVQALLEGTIDQFEMEKRYLRKDGQVVWGRVSVGLLRDDAGNPMVFLPMIQDITEYKQAEQAIRQLNLDLELRVQERTALLEETNKELEAFTYSVSHDLRAPLRGVDGYSKILLDAYRDVFDEQGLHYLHRLRESAQWMTQLVSALLDLSRLSRARIVLDQVNLSQMAEALLTQLHESQPERVVEISIEPDLLAQADVNLMRVALDNLLRNAWKFTSKHPSARIEFGRCSAGGEMAFFVRDDGAGFDMQQASKLFDAFQRLHTDAEFEGTGIGLAIVQRIIHRHGGRVWAEGVPEQGATFYFTLG
jgi:PAS domain S-box-containing protein